MNAERVAVALAKMPPEFVRYFLSRVVILPGDPCWYWGGQSKRPRVVQVPEGGGVSAFRVSNAIFGGRIPQTHREVVHHTCQNPPCINPVHLRWMTGSDHRLEHARIRRAVA